MNIHLLQEVANDLQPDTLMGSKWRNCQIETIVEQTIIACWNNYKKYGHAFSWYHRSLNTSENAEASRRLQDDGDIVVVLQPSILKHPKTTHCDVTGVPYILMVTDKLLSYVLTRLELLSEKK